MIEIEDVTKVYQMNRTDLLFRLRRQGEEKQLLISTHPDFYRLHLTEKKYANPMVPPRFCTYLRKYLTGARVDRVTQDPYERIVRLGRGRRPSAMSVCSVRAASRMAEAPEELSLAPNMA